jgi:transposase
VFKIIFLDKAGYHRAKALKVPQNMRLVYLPSSNPELNPVERLWGDMKAKVAFHNFKQEQELEEWITATAKGYGQRQIASLTGYPYILDAISNITTSME